MEIEKEYKGFNGTVILGEHSLVIKRGTRGFLFGGGMFRGDKTIPYSSVVAVQFKKPGISVGYIQFSLLGGSEAKSGVLQATQDENTITFQPLGRNTQKFLELKNVVEARMGHSSATNTHSSLDELVKLGNLKSSGVITEEEFQQKKKEILAS